MAAHANLSMLAQLPGAMMAMKLVGSPLDEYTLWAAQQVESMLQTYCFVAWHPGASLRHLASNDGSSAWTKWRGDGASKENRCVQASQAQERPRGYCSRGIRASTVGGSAAPMRTGAAANSALTTGQRRAPDAVRHGSEVERACGPRGGAPRRAPPTVRGGCAWSPSAH
eukprot:726552-Pleurochrysis_carterae.AAC.2